MEEIKSEQRDSIKLIKGSKCYNWEIKIYDEDVSATTVLGIEQLNNMMKEKFGTPVQAGETDE